MSERNLDADMDHGTKQVCAASQGRQEWVAARAVYPQARLPDRSGSKQGVPPPTTSHTYEISYFVYRRRRPENFGQGCKAAQLFLQGSHTSPDPG